MPTRRHGTKATSWGGRIEPETSRDAARTRRGLRLLWLYACLLGEPWVRRAPRKVVQALLRGGARAIARHLQIQLEISGLRHLQVGERYVVAPLHEGLLDPVALLHLPLPLRFAARDELFSWPLLGPALRQSGQIELRPEDGPRAYRDLLRGAREALGAGESVVVFPQGTILGLEADFTGGAFHLARALERPLLPIALTGSHQVWEHPYAPTLRYGERISLKVLPPISAQTLKERDLDEVRIECRRAVKTSALDSRMAAPRRFVPARDGYWDGYKYDIDPDFPSLHQEIRARRAGIRLPEETA